MTPDQAPNPTPQNSPSEGAGAGGAPDAEREKLVKKVADRVWQLWREDLRRERERLGAKSGR
ncbi:MAG: hypothetical protein ABI700_17095 [Chloroflexota bacterium]